MQSTIIDLEERKRRIGRGLDWLATSGIQVPPGNPDAGGVYAWIDATTGEPAYLYSEITGYFVTFSVQIDRHRDVLELQQGGWIERAEAAARWLTDTAQHESGAILCRKYSKSRAQPTDPWSFSGGRVAFFDCAMVGFGLLQLYGVTAEQRWLESADRIGAYCLKAHEEANHRTRHAVFDVHRGVPVPEGERWSQHFGAYELKAALFLDSLTEETGNPEYSALLERILERALTSQDASGRFFTHPRGSATHLHPHCYTIEGLLYLIARRGRRELLPAVARAIDWMFETCLLTDSPVQQWSQEPEFSIGGTRSDALAQALRAYEIAKALEPSLTWRWEPEVEKSYARVQSYETEDGATSYGSDEMGRKLHHRNAWAHFFRLEMELFGILRATHHPLGGSAFALT